MNYRDYGLSVLLHLSLLLVALITAPELVLQLGGYPGYEKNGKVIPRQAEITEIDITLNDIGIELEKKKKQKKETQCKDDMWYGGIGIVQASQDGTINEVFEGYPADKAGLLAGDKIVSSSEEDIRGEPGTVLILAIDRDGEILAFNIVRDKICYEKEEIAP